MSSLRKKEKEFDIRELVQPNIVIVAKSHNPSIITNDWLKKNCGMSSAVGDFAHTPFFSMCSTERVHLTVDSNRLQVTCKKDDFELLKFTSSVVRKYISTLPHVPYEAMGLNYSWRIKKREDLWPIELKINEKDIKQEFRELNWKFGSIMYGYSSKGYRLKMTFDIKEEKSLIEYLIADFNYHFDIKGVDIKNIAKFINLFAGKREESDKILRKILKNNEG